MEILTPNKFKFDRPAMVTWLKKAKVKTKEVPFVRIVQDNGVITQYYLNPEMEIIGNSNCKVGGKYKHKIL